ncbi:hypothetical protein BDW02DRAFT_31838 [Decorospora gaudefroyi]|uniref:Uncharacterized protein n=1 Tax=Decorospora gaudefroyi TaxID=184978 RepID=A0A6A5KSD8_9PLEO|nr:hypothetical protein BDW02DRAFT_31838 [Decorospora gaudefroyi]
MDHPTSSLVDEPEEHLIFRIFSFVLGVHVRYRGMVSFLIFHLPTQPDSLTCRTTASFAMEPVLSKPHGPLFHQHSPACGSGSHFSSYVYTPTIQGTVFHEVDVYEWTVICEACIAYSVRGNGKLTKKSNFCTTAHYVGSRSAVAPCITPHQLQVGFTTSLPCYHNSLLDRKEMTIPSPSHHILS